MAVSTDHAVRIRRDLEASFYARETAFSNLVGRVPDATLDDVLLIVSELVTNAVLHGEGEILVRTKLEDGCVLGEVTDEGPGFEPQLPKRDTMTPTTQGLCIVNRLAADWGVTDGAAHVWFSVGLAERELRASSASSMKRIRSARRADAGNPKDRRSDRRIEAALRATIGRTHPIAM
jgi:anti-sigma regulatory factor (Ser/Thr protein kinase)